MTERYDPYGFPYPLPNAYLIAWSYNVITRTGLDKALEALEAPKEPLMKDEHTFMFSEVEAREKIGLLKKDKSVQDIRVFELKPSQSLNPEDVPAGWNYDTLTLDGEDDG